jgi:MFS family permease
MTEVTRGSAPSYPYTRWNFVVIVLDAAFFFAGLAFIDPVVVLPILVDKLGGSQVTIGLVGGIQRAGWIIPQLVATSFVLHRRRKKPYVMWAVVLSRIPFCFLAVAFTLPWAGEHLRLLLFLLIGIYAVFFFGDGLVGVPWHDIIARTIPPNLRGRFFGSINLVGGLFIIGAAAVVRWVLADPSLPFPHNYGRLLIFMCGCMGLSTLFLTFMKEPEGAALDERQPLGRIILAIPATLRRYPSLFRVVIAQNIIGLTALSLPFYTVYAHSRLGVPDANGAFFIWAGIAGSMSASMVWAFVNDHRGPRTVIRGVTFFGLTVPLAALAMPRLASALGAESHVVYFYAGAFLLNGVCTSGVWMGFINYVLEIAPDSVRPLFLGLAATLSAPAVVAPLLGGLLLKIVSYETLFGIACGVAVASLLYVRTLDHPHRLEEPDANVRGAPAEQAAASPDPGSH